LARPGPRPEALRSDFGAGCSPSPSLEGGLLELRESAAKRSPGRTRGIAVDMLGLIIAVVVPAAGTPRQHLRHPVAGPGDRTGPLFLKAFTDAGFKAEVAVHGAALGVDVEVVERAPGHRGFAPIPKRGSSNSSWGR
jgi:hypothetical protein